MRIRRLSKAVDGLFKTVSVRFKAIDCDAARQQFGGLQAERPNLADLGALIILQRLAQTPEDCRAIRLATVIVTDQFSTPSHRRVVILGQLSIALTTVQNCDGGIDA